MAHEIHIARPDGTFVADNGPLAGLRVKLMSGNRVTGGSAVRVVHHAQEVPYIFDQSGKPKPPRPDLVVDAPADNIVKARPDIVEVTSVETYLQKAPTEANPFADLQVVIDDEDDIVEATIVEDSGEITNEDANRSNDMSPEELFDVLLERDIRTASLTPEEFNALKLSKKQLWHLHEQVIGRTVNKPTVPQAISNILKRANSNGANYRRVIDSIKRVKDKVQ